MRGTTKWFAESYAHEGTDFTSRPADNYEEIFEFLQTDAQERKYSDPVTTLAISAQPLNPFGRAAKFGYIA
jgi:hypothetical protein